MQEINNATTANLTGSESQNQTATGSALINIDPLVNAIQDIITNATGLTGIYVDVMASVLVLATCIILAIIVHFFVTNIAPRLVSSTHSVLDDEILKAIKGPISLLIFLIGVYLGIKSLDNLSSGILETLDSIATAILILVIAYFLGNLIGAFLRWYGKVVAPTTDSDLDDHLLPFMTKVIVAVVYILAILLILTRFGIEITALVASLGIAGIAVALAAQETLSNAFGAIAIMTDRPYKPGDRLLISGIGQCDVVEVGIRSTRVMTRNRQLVVIPNRDMASNEIVNLSLPDTRYRLRLTVGVAYKTDLDKACHIMEEIALANPLVSRDPASKAYVDKLDDFAVHISLYVWLSDYRNDYDVTDQVYREILARFKSEGIVIPYPIVTLNPVK